MMDFDEGSGPVNEGFQSARVQAVPEVRASSSIEHDVEREVPGVEHSGSVIDFSSRGRRPHRDALIAVLLPCKNEVLTIGKVVRDFQDALPNATVYVFDNASTDGTAEEATHAGAVVRFVQEPGKGNVIRTMFAQVEADVYVLADGDDTYDASRSPELVELLVSQSLDMVVGTRVADPDQVTAYPRGHRLGNSLFNYSVRMLFGARPGDMLTGYRVCSRRFVKSFPCMSKGFEVETELTLHAMDLRVPVAEVATKYAERPEDSASKLRTVEDGVKILRFLLSLFHSYRPFRFYGLLAATSLIAAGICELVNPVGLHSWSAATLVVVCLTGLAVLLLLLGSALACIRRGQRELKQMIYLAGHPSMSWPSVNSESVDRLPRTQVRIPKQVDVTFDQSTRTKALFDLATPVSTKLDA